MQANVQVVMRSGDAELDMRGRCSAGQKVLFSCLKFSSLMPRLTICDLSGDVAYSLSRCLGITCLTAC